MIITSCFRGRLKQAARYLTDKGDNEKVRTVDISDIDAETMDEAFRNMEAIAGHSKAKKPVHHISINPYKDEHLSDAAVLRIVRRCEEIFGYKLYEHQRVIVEHIKNGRQHFHVMWNRISLATGRVVEIGLDWFKAMFVARQMEKELGLRPVISKQIKRLRAMIEREGRYTKILGRYTTLSNPELASTMPQPQAGKDERPSSAPFQNEAMSDDPLRRRNDLLIWAWENDRTDLLTLFSIYLPKGMSDH